MIIESNIQLMFNRLDDINIICKLYNLQENNINHRSLIKKKYYETFN